MKKLLEHDIRKKIYDIILENPGLHFSKIAELLQSRPSVAEYHLTYMEKNKIIFSVKKEGEYYRRYYLNESELGVQDKIIMSFLRQEKFLYIISIFLRKDKLRHKDILKHMDITSSTLSYYINRLIKYKIIESSSSEEEPGYKLVDRKRVIYLIFKYQIHKMLDDFRDIWEELEH